MNRLIENLPLIVMVTTGSLAVIYGVYMVGVSMGRYIGKLEQRELYARERAREAEQRHQDFLEGFNQAQEAIEESGSIAIQDDLKRTSEIRELERLYGEGESNA